MSTGADSLGPLFDDRQLARSDDPSTSHDAARHMKRSGKLNAQAKAALDLLRAQVRTDDPIGKTSAELAGGNVSLRYMLARRLADLEAAKLVKKLPKKRCSRTGRLSHGWRPKEEAEC